VIGTDRRMSAPCARQGVPRILRKPHHHGPWSVEGFEHAKIQNLLHFFLVNLGKFMSIGVAHRKSQKSPGTEKRCGTTFYADTTFLLRFFWGFRSLKTGHRPWCCGFLKIRSPPSGKRDSPQTSRAPTEGHPRQRVLTQILKCQSPSIFTI
jgi:hypothetical protein